MDEDDRHRIAVVGSGPRGLGVVERLAARLAEDPAPEPVEILLIDAVEVGCGRIWRTDQAEWFVMNTVCGEVSMFSGPPGAGPDRPGRGPSLAEWWERTEPGTFPGRDGYAPRPLYGRYLHYVLACIRRALPEGVTLTDITATVTDLDFDGARHQLALGDGRTLRVDRVVLATGHCVVDASPADTEFAEFAETHPDLRYLPGDSPADMPLDAIPDGSSVGIIGLGLTFYDVVYALTLGRGGALVEGPSGEVDYRPSGREPRLTAGSRSGMPLPARGRNQKTAELGFKPALYTPERIFAAAPGLPLDFAADVLPWMQAELDLCYHVTVLRGRHGEFAASALARKVELLAQNGVPDVAAAAVEFGLEDLPRVDLARLSRPFEGEQYAGPQDFAARLLGALDEDIAHAEGGNVDDPLKAALDVMRDTRWATRLLVDFGGLDADSHRGAFLGEFSPRLSFLAAGPPRNRVRLVRALIEAGVVTVVGPDARFTADPESGAFTLVSPQVPGSRTEVSTLIDARIPPNDLNRDASPLIANLRRRGTLTEFVNGAGTARTFRTGAVAITRSPFHPIGADGAPDRSLYVLGLPTENVRWTTQVGSGRPGPWNEFTVDADAIAQDCLAPAYARSPVGAQTARI